MPVTSPVPAPVAPPIPAATAASHINTAPQILPPTSDGPGIRIDNVNQSVWQYARQHDTWALWLVPLVIIWEWLMIEFMLHSDGRGGQQIAYGIMLPVILVPSWYYRLKQKFEAAFLQQFAQANGFSFDQKGTVDEAYGTIFRMLGYHRVSDVVTGAYLGYDLRLFLHDLTVRQGRSSTTYRNTVIELDLKGQLPSMLLLSKLGLHAGLNLAGAYGQTHIISLEGDFDQHFTLHAPEQNEIAAREVFSPDTMAIMEDEASRYNVEFAGNRIYIYSNGYIGTTAGLTAAFALAKQLAAKLGPLASRMADDADMAVTPVNLNQSRVNGRVARIFVWVTLGFLILFILVILGLGIFLTLI